MICKPLYQIAFIFLSLAGSSARKLFPEPMMTTEDLVQVQLNTGLSNTGMQRLASTMNQVSKTKIVETNFRAKFQTIGQQLSDFFTESTIQVETGIQGKQMECLIIHCKDLSDLINHVLLSRQVFSDHIIKLGIDSGGGSLKVLLGVIELDSPLEPRPKRVLTNRIAKASGVKRQMLVAIGEELPENYNNVRQLWSLIQAGSSEFVISCDMKLANILCGLQSHASSHPCSWCTVESQRLSTCGELRTLGSLRNLYQGFRQSGCDIKKARAFGNVVHEPIISGKTDSLVLELIPPMELHLLLGVVNHIYKTLKTAWPRATEWPASLHINEEPFHGGHFAGNDCHKLLQNLDLLQHLAEKDSAFQVFPFIETFRKFQAVVASCFGMHLKDDFGEKIRQFKESYLALERCTITPKVHAVFFHVKQFIDLKKVSLCIYSEQATEAMHKQFGHHWQRYKRSSTHPDYASRLKACLVDFNSKHL